MLGKMFGRLRVVELSHLDDRHRKHYLCQCECGQAKTVQAGLLRSGNTRSCGCLSRDAKAAKRLPDNGGVINQIILQYKRHARDRGIEWLLSRDEVDAIVRKPCFYCGVAAGNIKRTKNCPEGFWYNGIDRAESCRPYVTGNVVPCCGLCNRAKNNLSQQDFIAWALRVAEQWGNQLALRNAA